MPKPPSALSRRERQILDVVFRLEQATAAEVLAALPDPPSYSAVRTHLHILEEKGHLAHNEDGKRYVYRPVQPRQNAAKSALQQVLHTFFGGSVEGAVSTLLTQEDTHLSKEELDRLSALIQAAREGEAR